MLRAISIRVMAVAAVLTAGAISRADDFTALRDAYMARYKPLMLEAAAAWWEATTTGSEAAFERKTKAEKALTDLNSDRDLFARAKALHGGGKITDPVQARELDVIHRLLLGGQGDPATQKRIVDIQNDVERKFNTHRSSVDGKELSENEVREILLASTDSAACEKAWKGYMAVGAKVEGDLRELVTLRNKLAVELGFPNYFSMSLALQEIDEKELMALLDELDGLISGPFGDVKSALDASRAKRFGIQPADLRHWHFGDLFFQDAPRSESVDFDAIYKDADILALTRDYYAGMGLPIEDVIARSDLYEKPGKSPHAFCSDLDREGDIRVLCNIKPNLYWADTVVHELGHGVYDKYIRRDVPWLLREASHSITTEGVAMMFGAMVLNEDWLRNVRKVDPAEAGRVAAAAREASRAEKLIFAQWAQVVVRFEHGMYNNPNQNLGELWWKLKGRYQKLNPPETTNRPDFAAKVHILANPVYYQSYLMGQLFAAQVRHRISTKVLGKDDVHASCFAGEPKVGKYLTEEVLGPGNLYSWNSLTRRATGESLTARYFVEALKK